MTARFDRITDNVIIGIRMAVADGRWTHTMVGRLYGGIPPYIVSQIARGELYPDAPGPISIAKTNYVNSQPWPPRRGPSEDSVTWAIRVIKAGGTDAEEQDAEMILGMWAEFRGAKTKREIWQKVQPLLTGVAKRGMRHAADVSWGDTGCHNGNMTAL